VITLEKETLSIVIVGHVDHGKSTLIGRLLLDTKSLPKEKMAELQRISKDLGKETELAYLTDQLKEEREQDKTIDTTQTFFRTTKRNYIIIDAPGHVEFIKNMLTGASSAEAAILIVDITKGVEEQTRRHAYIIKMLGIRHLIVVINKMDLVNFKKEQFEIVRSSLLDFLKKLGLQPLFIIPVSAKDGVNISGGSLLTKWYNGPALLKALNSLKPADRKKNPPLRFPVQDIYEINHEKIAAGEVVSGKIKEGEKIYILPSMKEAAINHIKTFGKHKKLAEDGENIGITLKGPLTLARGDVITGLNGYCKPRDKFKGNIIWLSKKPLRINDTLTFRCATQETLCTVEKIEQRINSSTLEVIQPEASGLNTNEAGEVFFKTARPVVVEDFSSIPALGRFILESDFNLQGAGIIIKG
jgi:sulfate adenylyltransferase large subunit